MPDNRLSPTLAPAITPLSQPSELVEDTYVSVGGDAHASSLLG